MPTLAKEMGKLVNNPLYSDITFIVEGEPQPGQYHDCQSTTCAFFSLCMRGCYFKLDLNANPFV